MNEYLLAKGGRLMGLASSAGYIMRMRLKRPMSRECPVLFIIQSVPNDADKSSMGIFYLENKISCDCF